jgi:anti-anti-sigma factor
MGETMENQAVFSPHSKLIIEHTVSEGGMRTLVCRGRITLETASHFRSEVKNLASQHKLLLADLSAVHSVDSAGLGVICATYISARSLGCELTLVNVHPRINDLLNITNLTSYLKGENAQSLPKTSIWG